MVTLCNYSIILVVRRVLMILMVAIKYQFLDDKTGSFTLYDAVLLQTIRVSVCSQHVVFVEQGTGPIIFGLSKIRGR